MIVTVVNIVVQPENVDQFILATLENHRHSIKEKGNLRFDVLQHRDNPAAFTLYEAYETDEAAAAHKKTAHYCKWRDTVETWMAKPREGFAHNVLAPLEKSAWNR
ncbi:MAG: antibiotic biosynthesis monooxygenase [Deltaproteobacteria bacterium HGW-Deltaproteobacteria-6]|jgi:autoinducer 2-degrading protein|nr:MAG: antibiotic biosynthesis monooxygenase [Deltaproteobacteria bacterium HGW-Deltaproteobacteria-6]